MTLEAHVEAVVAQALESKDARIAVVLVMLRDGTFEIQSGVNANVCNGYTGLRAALKVGQTITDGITDFLKLFPAD